ncbi:MAG: hypothetical protein OEN55_00865 [Alphaproteobacteria bacterium]|nr:hypothetical protein [Alphaproteobacteria bacterium]
MPPSHSVTLQRRRHGILQNVTSITNVDSIQGARIAAGFANRYAPTLTVPAKACSPLFGLEK